MRQEHHAFIVRRHFQLMSEALLPGGRERVRERLVHPSTPHGVEHYLFSRRGVERVVEMLDKQVSAVRERRPRSDFLPPEEIGELACRGGFHQKPVAEIVDKAVFIKVPVRLFEGIARSFRRSGSRDALLRRARRG